MICFFFGLPSAWLMSCFSVLCGWLRFHVWMIKHFFVTFPSVNSPSCFLSCLCFWLLDFQVGIMHVRRRLTCSSGRSCRCVWLTLWERSICCLTSSSVNLQSNWCRNGEYNEFKMEDMLHWAFPELCQISPQVHAKFFRTSRVWEQEARRPTCSEWVSSTFSCGYVFLLFVKHLDSLVLQAVARHAVIISCDVNSGQSWKQRNR